jgi:hypothetical protein
MPGDRGADDSRAGDDDAEAFGCTTLERECERSRGERLEELATVHVGLPAPLSIIGLPLEPATSLPLVTLVLRN